MPRSISGRVPPPPTRSAPSPPTQGQGLRSLRSDTRPKDRRRRQGRWRTVAPRSKDLETSGREPRGRVFMRAPPPSVPARSRPYRYRGPPPPPRGHPWSPVRTPRALLAPVSGFLAWRFTPRGAQGRRSARRPSGASFSLRGRHGTKGPPSGPIHRLCRGLCRRRRLHPARGRASAPAIAATNCRSVSPARPWSVVSKLTIS